MSPKPKFCCFLEKSSKIRPSYKPPATERMGRSFSAHFISPEYSPVLTAYSRLFSLQNIACLPCNFSSLQVGENTYFDPRKDKHGKKDELDGQRLENHGAKEKAISDI